MKTKPNYIERLAMHLLAQSQKQTKRPQRKARKIKPEEQARIQRLIEGIKKEGCLSCGYTKCSQALEFHHRSKTEKKFPISIAANREESEVIEELMKCTLLCANCHREVHAGLLEI
jgi:DNA invertase Pin-like site-specific DNA recombinase